MSQITLIDNAASGVVSTGNITGELKYTASFHVTYWNAGIADVALNEPHSSSFNSPSMSATLWATSMDDPTTRVGYGIADVRTVQNIGATVESNGQLKLYSNAGPTTPNMLTMTNQCSFPVMFQLEPDSAPVQIWQVPPNESASVQNGALFTATARVHDYPYEPIGSNGYDTPAVSFNNPAAFVTVWPNNSKGESFHIKVTSSADDSTDGL
jgi:hypothetical protein